MVDAVRPDRRRQIPGWRRTVVHFAFEPFPAAQCLRRARDDDGLDDRDLPHGVGTSDRPAAVLHGEDNIVFGSDSLWYGGPQWQIDALWRSQIPDDIADRWGYPQLNEGAKRKILGLNSARLYGLAPAAPQYRIGDLAGYATAPELQPGGRLDIVLRGPGYPEP